MIGRDVAQDFDGDDLGDAAPPLAGSAGIGPHVVAAHDDGILQQLVGELVGAVAGGGNLLQDHLALALELNGMPGAYALACDTDGIDGSEDNAGAVLAPDALARSAAVGLSAKKLLGNNDGYSFFEGLSDLVMTGPTRTNVNDYRAIVVL